MAWENTKGTVLGLLIFGNVLFFVAALYSYIDGSSIRDQLAETSAARDLAMVEREELRAENVRLKALTASKSAAQLPNPSGDLAKLEQLLDMRDAELAELRRQLENSSRQGGEGARTRDSAAASRSRENMQERMERLRTENPEEYARIQNFRENMQQRNQERIANRDNFFKNLDVSRMTAEQRETLTRYRDLLSASDELMTAGRGADREALRENYQSLREMRESVQELLLSNLAESNGIPAATLSDNLKDIMEITGGSFGGGRGGSARSGGGRPRR